jgi:glycosyltransferase involved in cell wall biosynthesis
MRIAQVAPLYESVPPKLYGGTERVVSNLTEELVRRGHEVTLFASGDSITSARLVPCCRESLRQDPDCKDQLAHHILMLEQVFAEKNNFDIIHFHIDYLHFPMSRCHKVVSLTTLHGRLDIPDLQPIYRVFDDVPVVSISDAQRAPLPWINWQGTVYHGYARNRYQYYPTGGDYLAFLGRVSPEKGVDEAIEIAKAAGRKLKIAAKVDKADQEYFDTVIHPKLNHPLIEFVGEIGYPEKNDFLGNAAAVLFPINWPEPFGLVMIEAMASGTPVIAYPRGSVSEIMNHGVSGFVVENIESAVRAVQDIKDIDRAQCRKYFESRFTDTRMADDYLAIYERLVGEEPEPLPLDDGVSVG